MKRQTLQIGSALLATTALSTLSTVAMAGTFENATAANGLAATTLTGATLSAQVFGSTGAANVTLGPIAYNIDFTNQLTSAFDVDVSVDGAKFSTANPVSVVTFQESAGSLTVAASNALCTVQVLTERILVDNCVSLAAGTGCRIDVLQLSGVQFNQANGLATSGSTITLSGIVTGNTGNQTFETLTAATVVTSANSMTTTNTPAGSVTINNAATPPFSKVAGSVTAAIVATVTATPTNAVGTNLTTVLSTSSLLVGGMEFTISHGILGEAATTEVQLSQSVGAQTQSVRKSNFVGNTASFNVTAANARGTFEIEVNFDGTTAIGSATAGTVDVVYTAGSVNASAPTGVTGGALAAFVQGGFRAQINTAQTSNSANFDSFVRITNNGTVAGTASIAVANDATGSVYGTYTTASIPANSTLQISMSDIESGTTPAIATVPAQFMLNISGAISGYAQHVMLNTQNGTFVDLSGFRIGDATAGFP